MKIINIPERELSEYTPADFGGIREEKTVCVIRYGAFGDMLQVSSILPLLKEQGYKVCVNVSPIGEDILKSNPYVDELLVQKTNMIPEGELTEYWENLPPLFEKVIQLSESIEASLLVVPDRPSTLRNGETVLAKADERFFWDKEKLHSECNVNYMERTHDLSGVPHIFNPKFYPTRQEREWAKKERKKIKSKHVILWSLSGSSVHKVYPWTDSVIASVLSRRKDVSFVTVGDDLCQLLEQGWEKEKRVITKSGKWSIRKTLSFVDRCSIVIGPETGVLNAASTLDNHKIVMLSHSSEENLSKHWINTTSLGPDYYDNFCFPCHKMHYGFNTCRRDEHTGGAMCAANIKPNDICKDIMKNLK